MPKVRPLSIPYVQSLERVCLKSLKLLVYEALSLKLVSSLAYTRARVP